VAHEHAAVSIFAALCIKTASAPKEGLNLNWQILQAAFKIDSICRNAATFAIGYILYSAKQNKVYGQRIFTREIFAATSLPGNR
jgi:hypothetical protein